MTGEFRGVAISRGQVSSSPGGAFPIQMPADILAGDWLIVAGSCYNLAILEHAVNPVAPATGWFAVNGPRDIFVKIADGSEAGALSTEFVTLDTTGLSGSTRSFVVAAFSYRFAVQPLHTGSTGPYGACFPYTLTPFPFAVGVPSADSFTYVGDFPSGSAQVGEFRFLQIAAQGNDGTNSNVISSATWYDNIGAIVDRTGLQSQAWDGEGLQDDSSYSWADQIDLPSDPTTGVIITAPVFVGGYLGGFSLRFPPLPLAYWGILASPITG